MSGPNSGYTNRATSFSGEGPVADRFRNPPAGSGGGAGAVPSLEYTVFVGKNGNDGTGDGSIGKPFLTVQAAMDYAWTTYVQPIGPQPAPPFTRPCVFVSAGTYDDGPLVLPPQICVMGEGFNHSRITGDWTIDARWSNYVPPPPPFPPSGTQVPDDMRSSWINVGLFGQVNIDFNAVGSDEGKLYALGCRFAGNVSIAEKRTNPVSNQIMLTTCQFLADVTLVGIPTLLVDCLTSGGTVFITQAIGTVFVDVDNVFQSSGGSLGNIVVTSKDAVMPPYDCIFDHAVQPGCSLTLDGQYSAIKADMSSLPFQSLISLSSGANINQITRTNPPNFAGLTADRPSTPYVGQQWFDQSVGRPTWWDGGNWIRADGTIVP